MLKSRDILLASLFSSFFVLSACGGDEDAGSASTSAPAASSEAPAAQESSSMGDIEKAEGVVYQDEIYANWPYN